MTYATTTIELTDYGPTVEIQYKITETGDGFHSPRETHREITAVCFEDGTDIGNDLYDKFLDEIEEAVHGKRRDLRPLKPIATKVLKVRSM